MEFEFVSFTKKNSKVNLGTAKVKISGSGIIINGITLKRNKKGLAFKIPHFFFGKNKKMENKGFPIIQFEKEENKLEFLRFLRENVKPIIKEMLKS